MKSQIGSWGNSLALRIPKYIADELALGSPKNKLPNFVGWASCLSLVISGQDARTTRNFWGFF
ncbi:hypothetical protein [Aphanizomenon flos-aquae]|uniref:AbrB/MazE/SpoVT family DNA-binding domain-containing protein n=1 Tax=Aphanizomenon flos-aquae TaxID=1176 RepID=UPI00057FCAAC|nr:hypothetical protein [Aphanizomenon flos-aquae]